MTEEKAKMSTGKKIVIGCIAAFLILTAAAYFIGVNYFSKHFLPGTMVNGFNCSYMTADETEELLAAKVGAYVLSINTRNNGQESITADQAGLTYQPDGSVKKLLLGQDRYLWFLAFSQKKDYDLETETIYDKEKLQGAVKGLSCMQKENTVEPQDAYIRDNGTTFEIVPEEMGTSLNRKKVHKLVAKAVSTGVATLDLEEQKAYVDPKVFQDDKTLIKDCKQMNKLTDVVITYDFSDRTETVDRTLIKTWLVKNKKGNYTLDKNLVAAYVNDLGFKYDTFGLARTFITYDGREVQIPAGGDYGWVINQEEETKALIKAIKSGETQVREPVYLYEGWSRNTNDIGSTYVEIDLANQRMVFYKDGIPMVDTLVVTGNPNVPGNETPAGCFAIDAMKSPAVLTGENYAAPVTYWMPFAGNVGIHDASWRTDFGGNLYMLEGSHGCVNTPYSQAEIIYQNIGIGCPVVVYK